MKLLFHSYATKINIFFIICLFAALFMVVKKYTVDFDDAIMIDIQSNNNANYPMNYDDYRQCLIKVIINILFFKIIYRKWKIVANYGRN